ncbi:MAG: LysR family transcriptional regulator [Clostridiales bacterium]|nr:LysR family transcriptional regulator [Clostridiales bacterium]
METHYLNEFVVLAGECNYSSAADLLYTSQSTLFKHMKSLENELSITLFNKSGNRIQLSKEGELFLNFSKRYLTMEKKLTNDIAQQKKRNDNVVYLASEYRSIELLLAFRMAHSDTLIHQVCDTPSAKSITSALRQGDCELAVLVNPEDPADEMVKIPLIEDVPVAVMYSVHPLAERPFVTFDDLRNENFVALDFNSMNLSGVLPPGDIVRSIFRTHNAVPNIVFTANRGTEMLDYIRQEIGISILYQKTLYSSNRKNIAIVPIRPAEKIQVCLCYLKNRKFSAGAQTFLSFVENAVAKGTIEELLCGGVERTE